MAPFAPFFSDEIYKNLTGEESVHTAFFPEFRAELVNEKIEEKMELVRTIVTLGRGVREKEKIKVRQPLSKILIDGKYEAVIGDLVPLIKEELNIKGVDFVRDFLLYMNYSRGVSFLRSSLHLHRLTSLRFY